jgi:hypothetical protein
MKKVLLSVVALALVAGFSSCKKSVQCECEFFGVKSSSACTKLNKKDRDALKSSCESTSTCKMVDC